MALKMSKNLLGVIAGQASIVTILMLVLLLSIVGAPILQQKKVVAQRLGADVAVTKAFAITEAILAGDAGRESLDTYASSFSASHLQHALAASSVEQPAGTQARSRRGSAARKPDPAVHQLRERRRQPAPFLWRARPRRRPAAARSLAGTRARDDRPVLRTVVPVHECASATSLWRCCCSAASACATTCAASSGCPRKRGATRSSMVCAAICTAAAIFCPGCW